MAQAKKGGEPKSGAVGGNAKEHLRSFCERVERLKEEAKAIADDIKDVFAEAKANGFDTKTLRAIIKLRSQDPNERAEAEALLDTYKHAVGLAEAPDVFRQIEALAGDDMGRDAVIESMKALVPRGGSIVVELGGAPPMRITRADNGDVTVAEVVPPRKPKGGGGRAEPSPMPERPQAEVPDCSPKEAEKLGVDAAKNGQPVTANPFPFGDKRQARWDTGWRKESGGDGMGPDTGEDD